MYIKVYIMYIKIYIVINIKVQNKGDNMNKKTIKPYKSNLIVMLALIAVGLLLILLMTASICEPTSMNAGVSPSMPMDSNENFIETIVISNPLDPYYSLALEIAGSEDAVLIDSVEQINNYYPKYIVWVISPENLSEKKLLELSYYYKDNNRFSAAGIITGLTLESAKGLWERGVLAEEGRNYFAGDYEIDAGILESIIIDVSTELNKEYILNKENLVNALADADYFYWSRHVSPTRWFWHPDPGIEEYEFFYADDIPDLKPVIIHTPSCSSFMPWKEDSIAMGFIEKGAAAYIGDLFSPTSAGIFIGHLKYIPGKYTWDGFPLGIMAQIQNRYMSRASHNMPVFFMLGNPKISLQEEKPYKILSDRENGNNRTIEGICENKGILPIKIENGAQYSFIRIKGVASSGDDDLFYNGKVQSINIHSDKYVLLLHEGGNFEIELSKSTPFLWTIYDGIRDSFEHSWITIGVVQSLISIFFLGVFLLIFLIYKLKKKIPIKSCLLAMGVGFIFALLQLLFIVLQEDHVTASSYIKTYPVFELILGFVGTFSLVSGGLILMLGAKKKILKVLGMIACVLPQIMLAIFNSITRIITNLTYSKLDLPAPWNYSYVYQILIVLSVEVLVFLASYFIIKRLEKTE
jgi:hypothetical protein